jgi:CheY-like chemotaxis protein
MFVARRRNGKPVDSAIRRFQCETVRHVLVIDDEPLVALMIQRTLEPAYKVSVQHSGRAALELFERGERYDAVITDLRMPDGDGGWLHGEIARIDPAQAGRMVFLSGAPDEFLARPGVRWLGKPFRAAELIALIEAAFSGAAGGG